MHIDFSGSVHFANGAPVSGVMVRIFDKDASGKQDDDLTLVPGLTDEQGRFTLTYEPLRFMDYHTIDGSGIPEEPFNTTPSRSGLRFPNLDDIYLPYLQFNYTFNGLDRQHSLPMGFFQSKFLLPENPPVDFLPSTHGFGFPNSFSGYFLPFSTPAFLSSRKVSSKYGLCGGMCAAATDFALAGRAIPGNRAIPNQGTRLHRYLFRRQMDSMGGLGQQVAKVAQWTCLPDDTLLGTQARTNREFSLIRQKLDDRNPVVLALIYEHASSIKELSKVIFNNHQVLAYAYQQDGSGVVAIKVYDPNLPGRDDVVIQCEPVVLGTLASPTGTETAIGLLSTQLLGIVLYKQVRGYFAMPYQPEQPPKGI
jgi:hypothetical protein